MADSGLLRFPETSLLSRSTKASHNFLPFEVSADLVLIKVHDGLSQFVYLLRFTHIFLLSRSTKASHNFLPFEVSADLVLIKVHDGLSQFVYL